MVNLLGNRKVFIAAAAAALLSIAGCSNQPNEQAKAPAKKAPAKAAVAKPAPAKSAPAAKTASSKPADTKATAKQVKASSKVAPAAKLVTVPKGTLISTTLTQPLASNKNKAGDSFAGTLASSVKVDGKTVIPKGAKVTGHVITAKKKAPAELTVALTSVEVGGKSYSLSTNSLGSAQKKTDDADAAKQKNVALAAKAQLKFKLAKSVKLPVKS
jgi:hypothetical protein